MNYTYLIVLFKNRQRKKIIKGYQTEKKAKSFFKKYLKENNFIFCRKYENAELSNYQLGLISQQNQYKLDFYTTDEFGKNVSAKILDEGSFSFLELDTFCVEEYIFDNQNSQKISFDDLIKKYYPKSSFKCTYTVNNKLILQSDESCFLFTLKNKDDSYRLLDTIEKYFRDNSRNDSMFVKDVSSTQRKYLYKTLVEMGFDKKKLYRQSTTFSKRK